MGSDALETCLIAEDRGQDIPMPTHSLYGILTRSARRYPDKIALVSCNQSYGLLSSSDLPAVDDQKYLRWTYARLEDASKRLASSLVGRGLRKGTALVVFLHKSAELALCLWAAATLGCPFVPMDPTIAARPHELQHMLSLLEVGAMVVHENSIAEQLSVNASSQVQGIRLKLVADGYGENGWEALGGVLHRSEAPETRVEEQNMDDTALVLFTSGTTSLPKGCPHSNRTIVAMCQVAAMNFELDENRKSCNVMPMFHLGGFIDSLPIWAVGGTVVYPNMQFDAQSTLDAIEREKCTDTLLVPTMLHALLDGLTSVTRKTASLILVKLGGATVSAADVRLCIDVLHVSQVANSYGLTEGGILTRPFQSGTVRKTYDALPSGCMAPGTRARICLPGSRVPRKRGEVGELHEGGMTIISKYIAGDNSSFYTDKVGLWHMTGDQAIMEETGEIVILGRYKDIIIRAGTNISPPTIEKVLDQVEGIRSQVIGIPDDIAGEVPVAVIKMATVCNVSKTWLQEHVIKNLGAAFALERVFYLREIGADDFPKTASGKVRKVDIRHLIQELLWRESNTPNSTSPGSTETALIKIWAHFLGMPQDRILPTMSLEGIVDSVTVMRVRHQVRKELGKVISLEEINKNTNIKAQARILDSKNEKLLAGDSRMTSRPSAPSVDDVVHAGGNLVEYAQIRELVERKLHSLGLSWDEDVENVLPIWDFGQAFLDNQSGFLSGRFRLAFTCSDSTRIQIRTALEKTLSNHDILRTLAIRHGSLHHSHVVIRPSSRWFEAAITDVKAVEDLHGLRALHLSLPAKENTIPAPVPLFHITVTFVESQGSAAFILYANHSVFDATSLSMFLEDLGNVLVNHVAELPSRPSYSLFAKAYHSHRASLQSQISLKRHLSRLKGISGLRDALWPVRSSSPVQKLGQTSHEHDEASPPKTCDRILAHGATSQGVEGFTRLAKFVAISQLQSEHKVSHAVVIKAAVALLNVQQTGQSHALFTNSQLSRSWPFLEQSIADLLPDPMDLPGPTIEKVFNKIEIRPEERVLTFLQRLQSDQDGLTEHAQVPIWALREQLGREDGDVLVEILQRQFFQYAPLLQSEVGSPLQMVEWKGHADIGIIWFCGMVDAETFQMQVIYNDAFFRPAEVERLLGSLMRIIQWTMDPESWEKAVRECPC